MEPLSEREREVLRLLAAGLESPEIARELIIGVSTARTHIRNIYGKLDVHGRVQAIERAHALGLVRPVASIARAGGPGRAPRSARRVRFFAPQTRVYESFSIPTIPYSHPLYAG